MARIRKLQDIERQRKKELEEMEKKKRELEHATKELEESIQEQQQDEQKLLEEQEEEERKRKMVEQLDLGQLVKDSPRVEEIIKGVPQDVYGITDYNVVTTMERIMQEAESRNLTTEEQQFVENVQYNMEKLKEDNPYIKKEQEQYLKRVDGVLKNLDKKLGLG
ncbi:MAG: hypothetical protein V1725_07370 [archaeon]